MPTAEIHDSNGRYAGYAVFGSNGEFQGTRGGYGTGRGGRGNRQARNGASRVQNNIRLTSANQARRGVVRNGA